jgi:hypothetical protein
VFRVTVEKIPFGNEDKKTILGVIEIENNLKHPKSPHKGDYDVKYFPSGGPKPLRFFGLAKNHDTRKSDWNLIHKVIQRLPVQS